MRGHLIAFEGLDQSGKQTQAELLREYMATTGQACRLLSFPDYTTPIGAEIGRALHGQSRYDADVMQLLYVANRHERRAEIEQALGSGIALLCDRYVASSVAYGEAQSLDPMWLTEIQRMLPSPDLTILLDIAPQTASRRKASGRDRYERDLALLARVRASYLRQATTSAGWSVLDGERPRDVVAADVISAVASRLAPR